VVDVVAESGKDQAELAELVEQRLHVRLRDDGVAAVHDHNTMVEVVELVIVAVVKAVNLHQEGANDLRLDAVEREEIEVVKQHPGHPNLLALRKLKDVDVEHLQSFVMAVED